MKAAAGHGLKMRQNYNRETPRLACQTCRYAHAKQCKRMKGTADLALARGSCDARRQPATRWRGVAKPRS